MIWPNCRPTYRVSSCCFLTLQEVLQDQQVDLPRLLSNYFSCVSEHTKFSIFPVRAKSTSHKLLAVSQTPLAFKIKLSVVTSTKCRTPKLGGSDVGLRPLTPWEESAIVTIFVFWGHLHPDIYFIFSFAFHCFSFHLFVRLPHTTVLPSCFFFLRTVLIPASCTKS